MAFSTQQIHGAVRDTYNHVNDTVYGGRLPVWGSFDFKITDAARTMGCVKYRRTPYTNSYSVSRLEISARSPDLAALSNTVRHEIAHIAAVVIDGERGHGYGWMKHARLCGADPIRCYQGAEVVRRPGDYIVYCERECGKEVLFTKRTRNVQRAASGLLKVRCKGCNDTTTYLVRQV